MGEVATGWRFHAVVVGKAKLIRIAGVERLKTLIKCMNLYYRNQSRVGGQLLTPYEGRFRLSVKEARARHILAFGMPVWVGN